MATTKKATRTALGGKAYLNPKTKKPVINQKTGKPYTWSPRAYMTKDKNGNAMVEINMPSTMVKRPNNFFCTGVKHKNVINKATGKKDVITYVKGYVRLNRKTTNGHDARLYYVAREFYMGGKPGIFAIHYKGDNFYRAEDIFNDIPFHDGWVETYNKKQNKNYQMGIKSDGTRKSQIEYVNKRRQEYRNWKAKKNR